jgi:hypothetical protein
MSGPRIESVASEYETEVLTTQTTILGLHEDVTAVGLCLAYVYL